jgi:hypothetical protein
LLRFLHLGGEDKPDHIIIGYFYLKI